MPPHTCFNPSGSETTRRRLILGAAAGAVGSAATLSIARAAPAKLAPADIAYQPKPKGRLQCDLCVNWQPPESCKVVSGSISPSGWCGLFVRKP